MDWLNALLLFVLIAGHTECLVTVVNRLHALPFPHRVLRQIRHVHDVLVPLFPLVLVWFVGLRGPRLLFGGRWLDVPAGWKLYLAICGLGTLGLTISTAWHLLRPVPKVQVSNDSREVNIARRLGYRPIADGPFHWLARMAGEGIFRLEVAEKTYRLPRLPAAWDGLSVLHLSDLHMIGTIDRPFFEEVASVAAELAPDMIVFTGDLLDDQTLVDWLPSTLGKLKAPLGCYFILGNHDWYLDPAPIRQSLSALGWIDLAGKHRRIQHHGEWLSIAGTEMPWMGTHPEDLPEAGNDDFRILLSHTPDNLGWARAHNIDLMLSGHNHGGQFVLPIIGPVYSPSLHGCRYAGGVFWEPPTLLYVSRGISGRYPLRWNCPPELTKLLLRPTR